MSGIRGIFFRVCLGLCLFLGVAVAPVQADVAAYLSGKHPIKQPAGAVGLCANYAWACAVTRGSSRFDDRDLATVQRVNRRINNRVREITDARQYRREEVWALPTRKGGDCEDFALLKKRELIRAGIPADRLLIATVLDKKMRGHAVLVVRSHRGDLVLDNLTNRILPWDQTGYIFLKMQNPKRPRNWDAILAGGALMKRAARS